MNKSGLIFIALILFLGSSSYAEPLESTIRGRASDYAELETLSPSADIPSVQSLLFSLDGGNAAVNNRVVPLTIEEAALMSDLSDAPLPSLPLIPASPFLVQALPVGDKFDLKRNQIFNKENSQSHYQWEFHVVDDQNNKITVHQSTGRPPSLLTWDGRINGEFVMKPDTIYHSYLVVRSSLTMIGTWPGEAVRFLSFSRVEGEDMIIEFGERLYESDGRSFSKSGQIYLGDVAQRLYDHEGEWVVETSSPTHAKVWKTYLTDLLDKRIKKKRIQQRLDSTDATATRLVLKNYKSPQDFDMRGTPSPPRPLFDKAEGWITHEELKDEVRIGLRHDRLFSVGSAYLRDQALPVLVDTLELIERKRGEDHPKTIVLRSYLERVYDKKRIKEEVDPALAALRSKVLFMLLAEKRFAD